MGSKVKKFNNYVVLHRGMIEGGVRVLGRYRVGAKNESEAEELLRSHIGKHSKVKVYFKCKDLKLKYKEVVKE